MTRVLWVVDPYGVERMRLSGRVDPAVAARFVGDDAIIACIEHPCQLDGRVPTDAVVVPWGRGHHVRAVRTHVADARGVFDAPELHAYAHYVRELQHLPLLNPLAEEITLGDALTRCAERAWFLRPARTRKAFNGGVVDIRHDPERAAALRALPAETPVMIAPARTDVLGESRFVVVDGAVATGSTYRWDRRADVRTDVPTIAHDLARLVARTMAPGPPGYVVDVAITDAHEALIVECNALASSGLYACDTVAIAYAVNRYLTQWPPSSRRETS